jgi:2-dehydropantoate 2-reductase
MWEKFAFITSTAVLTCLVGDEVGPIARADGGIALARRVLAEVAAVAAADGFPLDDTTRSGVDAIVTDAGGLVGRHRRSQPPRRLTLAATGVSQVAELL